jgi:hypothetical protein
MDLRHHEYILEVFADQTFVKDIVKGKHASAAAVEFARRRDSTYRSVLTHLSVDCRSATYDILPPIFPTCSTYAIHTDSFILSLLFAISPVSADSSPRNP